MDSTTPTNQPTPEVLQLILDHPYEALAKAGLPEWLKEHTSNYLVGEHPPASRKLTHCHILVEGLKVTRESLRKAVVKCCTGKKQYAIMSLTQDQKLPYDQKLLAKYIIKSNLSFVKSTSFDDAYLAIRASEWVDRTKRSEAEQGNLNAKPLTAKRTAPNIYQRCADILDNELARPNRQTELDFNIKQGRFHETVESRTEVVRGIIAYANRVGLALHSIQVMNYYDIIMCNACPEYYKTLCVDLINRRHR